MCLSGHEKTVGEPIEAFEVFYQKDLRALMVVWFG